MCCSGSLYIQYDKTKFSCQAEQLCVLFPSEGTGSQQSLLVGTEFGVFSVHKNAMVRLDSDYD